MAFLLNIYDTGAIVETHVLATREEGEKIYAEFIEAKEDDYSKGVCSYSLTSHEDLELTSHEDLELTSHEDLELTSHEDLELTSHDDLELTKTKNKKPKK